MRIHKLTYRYPTPIFYNNGFKIVLEAHIPILLTKSTTKTQVASGQLRDKYAGDFYGLLRELKITDALHWITLKMNRLDSPASDFSHLQEIIYPSYTDIELLANTYKSRVTK